MVENEKIIKEDIKLPNDILSETDEIKLEDNNDEVKLEEKEEIKVADTKFTEEQQKDFNRLLELDVEPEKAKKIILGESVEIEKTDFEGKSEYEVEKEFLAKNGIDLDLIKKAEPKVVIYLLNFCMNLMDIMLIKIMK